ncbi:hypothetical protein [Deinococcus soli (ex Cha et al. 2016)]|uniref:Uncharacterized protein n=1 Tax=Deinococcus soli (ex Cha et al. 2016) TaxID=1309411 RepID=A0A0F7JP46_9DEIO|nr:hypothetical protein [Deinococcus soli (ex Cha et al. 2016)]AKH16603.1 hypothetical protein SY84_05520 [Deinococcus soli (ex Cha et al. 2016)]
MRPVHLLLPLLFLTACKPGGAASDGAVPGREDLVARTLFTATGSFDAQADARERIGGGLRRATWTSRPPLDAAGVVVQYDSDARPLSWRLDIRSPRFTAQDLAGPDAQAVTTTQGEALHPVAGSRLADTLILTTTQGLRVVTRGYATQEDAALLPAFRR